MANPSFALMAVTTALAIMAKQSALRWPAPVQVARQHQLSASIVVRHIMKETLGELLMDVIPVLVLQVRSAVPL
jgi:hypothetical protein